MLILIPHGSYHRLQFISGNPSFRCGRHAKWSSEVCMDPIMDCSSSLETHHSAAGVLHSAHLKSAWDLKGCLIAFCGPQGWFQGGPGARFAVPDVFCSPQCRFRGGPGATFGVPDVCLGFQDAARCRQDGLKLDSTCHLELSECFRTFIDVVQPFKISVMPGCSKEAIRMPLG